MTKRENEKLDGFLKENSLKKDDVVIYPLSKGIAQGMLLHCPHIEVEEVDELSDTSERGQGALGSSGK